MSKSNRKTLKQKAYEYQELESLFDIERAKAKTHIIYGKLKLEFLKWLEKSHAHNAHHEWETEKYKDEHWEAYAWQEAVVKLAEDLRSDGFYADIIGKKNSYKIKVGFYDKNDPKLKETRKELDKILKEREIIPFDVKKDLYKFYKGLFGLHEKDEVFEHPKHKEFMAILNKNYKKGMTSEELIELLLKGNKSSKGKSLLSGLMTSSRT
tara:strand:- start:2094 stop:2720 length:627 start_codon:yes stop_codon:yes gene_type:complete